MATQVLTNQTANTTSTVQTYSSTTTIIAEGLFDGAEVHVDISSSSFTRWNAVYTFQQAGQINLDLNGTGLEWRVRVLDVGVDTNISISSGV